MDSFFISVFACAEWPSKLTGRIIEPAEQKDNEGRTSLPSTARSARVRVPQEGEAQALLEQNYLWKLNMPIRAEKKSTPCPLHLERDKPTCRSITIIWARFAFGNMTIGG